MLLELVVVVLLVAGLAAGIAYYVRQRVLQRRCAEHLHQVYSAIELYEIDRGTLPRLAFFPDEPKQDNDSMLVALRTYGTGEPVYVCPALPPRHRALGLTYVWNVQLNGKKLHGPGAPSWMLVEVSAVSRDVPAPHLGKYNVLYTDGSVQALRNAPPGLQEM